MSCEATALTTRRRLISPPRYRGRPKAAMDALAITVLSRSKKAALMPSVSHQQLLYLVLGIGGDQHQDLVADRQPGIAPGHDQTVAPHHGHHRGLPGHPELDQRDAGRRRVLGQSDLH